MTRIDSVRHAADVTKDSVRHAAEVAAPYAGTAKDGAVYYGRQYGRQAGVYGRQAAVMARQQYDARLAERVERLVEQLREQAMAAVPPKAASTMGTVTTRTAQGARAAADYTAPKIGTAITVTRAAAGPARVEMAMRGGAALQALRGSVSAADIDRLVRQRVRRERTGRAFRGLIVMGLAGSAAFAAFRWWSKQSNPDWLVEPAGATADDRAAMNGTGTLTVVDPLEEGLGEGKGSMGGSGQVRRVDGHGLDPEKEAGRSDNERPDDER